MSASSHTTEIERELAGLGEAPPSAAELALLAQLDADGTDGADEVDDVVVVARLTELAEPFAFEDLSELETHRSWRTVEQRLARTDANAGDIEAGTEPQTEPSEHRRPTPSGGGPRRWLFAAIGVAAAAAIVLIVVRPPTNETVAETRVDAEAVAELGEQARASLKVLDNGTSDTQRAEQLAAEYQARLAKEGG